jgi:glycosyltransferase involved in cell wall biosynthesis
VDHAIRTVKLLVERNVPVQLTIVGGGESKADLDQLTKELRLKDKIIFTGQLTEAEKNSQLQQAHFLIHTSLREGWGLNVIEANAMGTPAAVYPVGGLVDSTVHGETGLVTREETPESLADALAEIVGKPELYSQYRDRAWERSKTFFWPAILPEIVAWLEAHAKRR